MQKHFQVAPFLAGVLLGYLLVFYQKSEPRVITDFPHPQNVNERVYRDQNGVCYQYTSTKVSCDENEGTLKMQPLQN